MFERISALYLTVSVAPGLRCLPFEPLQKDMSRSSLIMMSRTIYHCVWSWFEMHVFSLCVFAERNVPKVLLRSSPFTACNPCDVMLHGSRGITSHEYVVVWCLLCFSESCLRSRNEGPANSTQYSQVHSFLCFVRFGFDLVVCYVRVKWSVEYPI